MNQGVPGSRCDNVTHCWGHSVEGAWALSAEEAGSQRLLRERARHQQGLSGSCGTAAAAREVLAPTPLTAVSSPAGPAAPPPPPHLLTGSGPARRPACPPCPPCPACPGPAPAAPCPTWALPSALPGKEPALVNGPLSGCGLAETGTGCSWPSPRRRWAPSGRALSLGPGPPPGGSAEEEGAPGRAGPHPAPHRSEGRLQSAG